MTSVAREGTVGNQPTLTEETDSLPAPPQTRDVILVLAVGWLVFVVTVVVLGAVFGDALPFLSDPNEINVDEINASPSWAHPFGNASFGEDVLSQVVEGGRISLFVGLSVTLIGLVLGGGLGLIAGFYRGWADSVVRLVVNATLSIPALLLVIFIVTIRDQALSTVIFALSMLAIPALARVVRATTLQVTERDYVAASEVLGVSRIRTLLREVLPNVMPTLVSFAFLTTGIVIVVEGTLSYLGLSVEAPAITWGSIIGEGRIKFAETPHMVAMPGLVIFLTVLALSFIGDRLLKRFDIREVSL